MIRKAYSQAFSAALPAFDYKPEPYKGIPYEQVVQDRKDYVPKFNFHLYTQPLLMV